MTTATAKSPEIVKGTSAGEQDKRKLTWAAALRKAGASVFGVLLLSILTGLVLWTLRVYDHSPDVFWRIVLGTFMFFALLSVLTSKWGASLEAKSLPPAPPDRLTSEYLALVVQVWTQVISVQMHFNEMLMRTRNYALTLVLAVVGGAAVALEKASVIEVAGTVVGEISLGALLLLLGVAGLLSFYLLDRFYYHPLLVAAVYKAVEIERWIFEKLPAIDLAGVITEHSRKQVGPVKFYARNKLTVFYLSIAILLAASAGMMKDVGVAKSQVGNVAKPVRCEIPIAGDSLFLTSTRGCVVGLPTKH